MKPFLALSAAAAMLSIVACGPSEAEMAAEKAKMEADSIAAAAAVEKSYTVDLGASKVNWTGTMLGIKSHNGDLNFAEGSFTTKGGQLTGGSFVVDMKNYVVYDTNYNKEYTKEKLMGHLMSPDFFAVDSFPTATLKLTGVEGNKAMADLTVRGKTNPETITDIEMTPNADGTITASGKLVFDRQKYGVAWSSGSKDAVLNNDIELKVSVTGKPN